MVKHKLNALLKREEVNHGDMGYCPTCGAPGTFDNATNNKAIFEDAIWFNSLEKYWECYACWLK